MSHLPVQSFLAAETPSFFPTSRSHTRTLSLLSISSATSMQSVFDIIKGEPTVTVSQRPEKHEAWGSFIPLRSATTSLREFVSVMPHSSPKRRRTPSYNIRKSISSCCDDNPPSLTVPYITRTLPPSPVLGPPSPTSSSSSSIISRNVQSDLHPILQQLENKSKLCTKKFYCSTCGKAGSDFPRCGKCGEIWCSRPCRLVGGKRHVCNSST